MSARPYRLEFPDATEDGGFVRERNWPTLERAFHEARCAQNWVKKSELSPANPAYVAVITNRETGYRWILRRGSTKVEFQTPEMLAEHIGRSSGGDIMCQYDYSNGGHFIFTEFASASTQASGGPFSGCFAGVANTCFEGIAVTKASNPFGPYNVYFLNTNYNPAEPGAPFLLNDFTKIAVTMDAFELFYDEFPQVTPMAAAASTVRRNTPSTRTRWSSACPSPSGTASLIPSSTSRSRTWACWRRRTAHVPRTTSSNGPASPAGSRSSRRCRRTRPSTTTPMAGPGSCSTISTTTARATTGSRYSTGPGSAR